jgi:hypothetical protein
MRTLSPDTTIDAERVQIRLWREMPAWRKMELVAEMNATVKQLARAGLVQRFPQASPQEIERRLADILLGAELAARVSGTPANETPAAPKRSIVHHRPPGSVQ